MALGGGLKSDLLKYLRRVGLHRPLVYAETSRNGAVGEALGEETQHFELARGEAGETVAVTTATEQSGDDRGVDDGLTFDETPERVRQRNVESSMIRSLSK